MSATLLPWAEWHEACEDARARAVLARLRALNAANLVLGAKAPRCLSGLLHAGFDSYKSGELAEAERCRQLAAEAMP